MATRGHRLDRYTYARGTTQLVLIWRQGFGKFDSHTIWKCMDVVLVTWEMCCATVGGHCTS